MKSEPGKTGARQRDVNREPLEMLATEFVERQRKGELPSIEQYVRDYPDLAEAIRELFPTIAAMERLKTQKQRENDVTRAGQLTQLGDFRLLHEVGRGGMGIVYLAEQESLGRQVAVKVLPRQALLAKKHLQRFEREARLAASLHHTNIVPVFGVGEQDGYHYYVMQYIRGVGLDRVLAQLGARYRKGPPSVRSSTSPSQSNPLVDVAVELLAEQSSAPHVDAAATPATTPHGIGDDLDSSVLTSGPSVSSSVPIHPGPDKDRLDNSPAQIPDTVVARELPAAETVAESTRAAGHDKQTTDADLRLSPRYWRNVAELGKQIAEALHYAHGQDTLHRDIKPANLLLDAHGKVWITDFGLAKAMAQSNVSQTGDIVGTLRYMAPEQFRGQADTRSDLYSLGITLYELATLTPAFDDADHHRFLAEVGNRSPEPPRRVNPEIPADLETILLKAIAIDPADRYETSLALAEDLQRFLEDRPIRARRFSPLERLVRWCRRNRAVAALSTTAALLLMLVALITSIASYQTSQANKALNQFLERESDLRTTAELNLTMALEALDDVFETFAPRRSVPAGELTLEGAEGEEFTIPVQPPVSPETAELLMELLTFYDRFAEQNEGDNAALRIAAARANRKVGDILQRLGKYDQALEAYEVAARQFLELGPLVQVDQQAALQIEVARLHNERGAVHRALMQQPAAIQSFRAAIEQLTSLPRTDSAEWRFELARTYTFLALAMPPPGPIPFGRPGDARGRFGERLGSRLTNRPFRRPPPNGIPAPDGIPAANPNRPPSPYAPSPNSGPGPAADGVPPAERPPPAAHSPREGRSTREGRPPRPDLRDGPGGLRESRGSRPGADGRRGAPPTSDDSTSDDPQYRRPDLPGPGRPPRDGRFQGGPAAPAPRYDETRSDLLERATGLLEGLVKDYPQVPDYRQLLSLCYRHLAPSRFWEDPQQGMAAMEKAVQLLEELVAQHPQIPDYRDDLCQAYALLNVRGPLPFLHERGGAFEANLQQALELSRTLVQQNPDVPRYRVTLGDIAARLGEMQRHSSRYLPEASRAELLRDANDLLAEASTLQTTLVQEYPAVTSYRLSLLKTQHQRAEVLRDLQRREEAVEVIRDAVRNIATLTAQGESQTRLWEFISARFRRLAEELQE